MSLTPEFVLITIIFLWSLVLTVLLLKIYVSQSKVINKGKKESFVHLIEEVFKKEEDNKKELDLLRSQYAKLEESGLSHIQKVGLVRFNPFKDTGGDQSFILALVDATNTGVVISSLHTRTGTRWYAKSVIAGRGLEYDLSEEEEKALKGAAFLSKNPTTRKNG